MKGPMSWREVRELLGEDRRRLEAWLQPLGLDFSPWHQAYVCVFLYRVSHYLHRNGHKYAARFAWQLNSYVTGSDIPPPVEIGGGFLAPCPAGVAVAGRIGRNLTLMPCAGVGGEIGRYQDIGAGPGLPIVGDDVTLEPHSGIMGPIRVGNRVHLSACAAAVFDVEDDTALAAPGVRVMKQTVKR